MPAGFPALVPAGFPALDPPLGTVYSPGGESGTGWCLEILARVRRRPIDSTTPLQEPLPGSLDALLARVGPEKATIYRLVRQILDDLEAAAPWDALYYPPEDRMAFLAMEQSLVEVIDGIPQRVGELADGFRGDAAAADLVGSAEFYFENIHGSVSHELAKLRAKVKASRSRGDDDLTADQRAFTCEISADLKGKYASSIMGAAASLVAEGPWQGIEIEPVLFPEKAEEFERNGQLVETLTEVVENINNLLAEIPLAELVPQWESGKRVDQYALTPLYSLLGNIGKLMSEKSRRALYSGDYHQIQKRENLLSARVNELVTIHNQTWATDADSEAVLPDGRNPFPLMIRKATELASILDLNILREIVGDKTVKDLLFIVTLEKERHEAALATGGGQQAQLSSLRRSVPEALHSLIPLLYDEDLQNFLGFLLGSVLKRASLSLRAEMNRQRDDTPAGPHSEADLDFSELVALEEPEEPAAPPPIDEAPRVEEPEEPAAPPSIDELPDIEVVPVEELLQAAGRPPADAAPVVGEVAVFDEVTVFDELPGLAEVPRVEVAEPAAALVESLPPVEGLWDDSEPSTVLEEDPTLITAAEQEEDFPSAGSAALAHLEDLLSGLLSRSNVHRKSFELVHRLLERRKVVPASMLQSMHPYLYDMMNTLVPHLHELDGISADFPRRAADLIEACTLLCDKNLTPAQIKVEVPHSMQRVLQLLDELQRLTVEQLTAQLGKR